MGSRCHKDRGVDRELCAVRGREGVWLRHRGADPGPASGRSRGSRLSKGSLGPAGGGESEAQAQEAGKTACRSPGDTGGFPGSQWPSPTVWGRCGDHQPGKAAAARSVRPGEGGVRGPCGRVGRGGEGRLPQLPAVPAGGRVSALGARRFGSHNSPVRAAAGR